MPNETNWQDITRRLDINEASVTDTCYPKTRGKGRAIRKVPWTFVVPGMTQSLVAATTAVEGCLIHQFNYTAPSAFRLMDYSIFPHNVAGTQLPFVCVKWRVDGVVYRYNLLYNNSAIDIITEHNRKVQATVYSGQKIQPNFCIEFWTHFLNYQIPAAFRIITTVDSTFTTNLLSLPDDMELTPETFSISEDIARATLVSTFPEVLPTVTVDNSSWLNN